MLVGEEYANSGGDWEVAQREGQRRSDELAALKIYLTDFRLIWDALARALAGRDKVIVDAENMPGRRHLLMFDPESFRPIPPMMFPPERSPRNPRGETRDEGP